MEYIYGAEGHRVAQGTITPAAPGQLLSCNLSTNGIRAGCPIQAALGLSGDGDAALRGERVRTETDGNGNWQHTNVYAGSELLATYDAAGLHFYLADPLGTRRVQLNSAGQVEGTDASLPYGDGFAQTASDDPTTQHYAQLSFDAETGLDHAEARQYAPWMGRWTAPDPYNDSYDLANPQSLNRYAYVNNNPLGFVDPSGEAGGVTGWGGVCKIGGNIDGNAFQQFGGFNPCNPIVSIISAGVVYSGLATSLGIVPAASASMTAAQIAIRQMAAVGAVVNAAFTIACSIDNFNSAMCGPSGWTSIAFGSNSVVGKVINDQIAAEGAALCVAAAMGGIGAAPCIGYAIYSVANAVFSWAWSAFSGPQFTGSLLPRPSALDGLGSSATGIPNKNLSLQEILGQPSTNAIPTPGQ